MSNNERFKELVLKRIDGDLTRAEERELQELLADDPIAKQDHDALIQTAVLLDEMPSVDPPADMKAGIMAQIDGMEVPLAPPAGMGRRVSAWLADVRAAVTGPRVAFGVTAAAAAVALMLNVGHFSDVGTNGAVSGTMVPKHENLESVATTGLVSGETNGQASVMRDGKIVVVTIEMTEPVTSSVHIEYDAADLTLDKITSGDGTSMAFTDTQGFVVISETSHKTIVATFTDLTPRPTPIALSFATGSDRFVLSSGRSSN